MGYFFLGSNITFLADMKKKTNTHLIEFNSENLRQIFIFNTLCGNLYLGEKINLKWLG